MRYYSLPIGCVFGFVCLSDLLLLPGHWTPCSSVCWISGSFWWSVRLWVILRDILPRLRFVRLTCRFFITFIVLGIGSTMCCLWLLVATILSVGAGFCELDCKLHHWRLPNRELGRVWGRLSHETLHHDGQGCNTRPPCTPIYYRTQRRWLQRSISYGILMQWGFA